MHSGQLGWTEARHGVGSAAALIPVERVTLVAVPRTEYAKSGEVSIAYQAFGDGPVDLVFVPGFISHLELAWEEPYLARFLRRLATFTRVIFFDKRGTGLSDPVARPPGLEERMDDIRAVMDAAGSKRAALFGVSDGGCLCIAFAVAYPQRSASLVTYGSVDRLPRDKFARRQCAPPADASDRPVAFGDGIENGRIECDEALSGDGDQMAEALDAAKRTSAETLVVEIVDCDDGLSSGGIAAREHVDQRRHHCPCAVERHAGKCDGVSTARRATSTSHSGCLAKTNFYPFARKPATRREQ